MISFTTLLKVCITEYDLTVINLQTINNFYPSSQILSTCLQLIATAVIKRAIQVHTGITGYIKQNRTVFCMIAFFSFQGTRYILKINDRNVHLHL